MKNLWDNLCRCVWAGSKGVILGAVLCLSQPFMSSAQTYERLSDAEEEMFGSYLHVMSDYESTRQIRRYWVQEAQRLRSQRNLDFRITGSGESVMKVTMPSRLLFAPNDSVLINSVDAQLRPLMRLVRGENAVAQLVVVCHTDNNGSEGYLQRLSTGRANVLHRWMAKQGVGPGDVRSFGMAGHCPRNKNNNIREREQNRRVCFYFVPNKNMLRQAKKGKL